MLMHMIAILHSMLQNKDESSFLKNKSLEMIMVCVFQDGIGNSSYDIS